MIRIIVDSTCNLPTNVLEEYNIKIAPLTITINNTKYEDNIDIKSEDFYKQMNVMNDIPITDSPSSNKYYQLFKDGVMNGVEEFIVITMSSYIGGSYNAALNAQHMFMERNRIESVRISVIDSRCTSIGYGYLVLKTSMLRKSGVSYKDLVTYVEKYKTRVKLQSTLRDTLLLIKNGITKNTQKLKRLSDVEIIIDANNKGVGNFVTQFTTRKQVIEFLANEYTKQVDPQLTNFILIGYTDDLAYAEELREYIFANTEFKGDIYITQTSPTVGITLGLGAICISYVAKSSGNAFINLFS